MEEKQKCHTLFHHAIIGREQVDEDDYKAA
jgi:hypothetical protein